MERRESCFDLSSCYDPYICGDFAMNFFPLPITALGATQGDGITRMGVTRGS